MIWYILPKYVTNFQFFTQESHKFPLICHKFPFSLLAKMKANTILQKTMAEETQKTDYGAISWRIGPERKQQLIQKFGSASGLDVSKDVMDTYFVKYPELKEAFENAMTKNQSLLEEVQSLKSEIEALKNASDASFSAEVETARQTITDLQNQLNEAGQKLTAKDLEIDAIKAAAEAKANNPSSFSIIVENEIEQKFLQAIKAHLQERYRREVSFYEIFVKSAMLYNVEKRCDWFYPPLKDRQIEEATGLSIDTWKKFLNQKEK